MQEPLITSWHTSMANGKPVKLEFFTSTDFSELSNQKNTQIYGVCFYKNKLLTVFIEKKNTWVLAGGSIEKGETFKEAMCREAIEEANVRVIKYIPLGYQKVTEHDGNTYNQLRCYCEVEPIGEFIADPDEDVTEIAFVDPTEYKKYFDWKEIGYYLVSKGIELNQ